MLLSNVLHLATLKLNLAVTWIFTVMLAVFDTKPSWRTPPDQHQSLYARIVWTMRCGALPCKRSNDPQGARVTDSRVMAATRRPQHAGKHLRSLRQKHPTSLPLMLLNGHTLAAQVLARRSKH